MKRLKIQIVEKINKNEYRCIQELRNNNEKVEMILNEESLFDLIQKQDYYNIEVIPMDTEETIQLITYTLEIYKESNEVDIIKKEIVYSDYKEKYICKEDGIDFSSLNKDGTVPKRLINKYGNNIINMD